MKRSLYTVALILSVLGCKGPTSQAGGSTAQAGGEVKAAAAAAAPTVGNPKVVFDTSFGDIEIELFADKAPKGVKNFLRYVEEKLYDGTIFHRVIPNFVVQAGGFEPTFSKRKTYEPLQNEADNGLKNERGTLCWARTPDPHSATNQFFINLKPNESLDHREKSQSGWGYAVFGKVVKGMDVADKISLTQTTSNGPHQNVPAEPILIRAARLQK